MGGIALSTAVQVRLLLQTFLFLIPRLSGSSSPVGNAL